MKRRERLTLNQRLALADVLAAEPYPFGPSRGETVRTFKSLSRRGFLREDGSNLFRLTEQGREWLQAFFAEPAEGDGGCE